MPKEYGQTCPVARSLEFLGERWTLLIVRDLLIGPRKFQDFSASLRGVAPAAEVSRDAGRGSSRESSSRGEILV